MPARHVITIGNFDGVHVGHRAILAESRRVAVGAIESESNAIPVVAVTFDPPPIAVLRPGSQPPQIDGPEERIARLRHAGADEVQMIAFDQARLEQTAESFVAELVDRWQPVAIVEGPDFRFGKGRAGDHGRLTALGEQHGYRAIRLGREHATLSDRQSVPVSSSLVRWLVGRGRVSDAAVCLGRPFSLAARVVQGEQRGRTLGVPTANFDGDALRHRIIPADGVYAADARLEDGRTFPAAVSIGTKPTFHATPELTVEAHLVGFDGDLYGQKLTLDFVRWVRDQYAFPGLDALLHQLQRDVASAALLAP